MPHKGCTLNPTELFRIKGEMSFDVAAKTTSYAPEIGLSGHAYGWL